MSVAPVLTTEIHHVMFHSALLIILLDK